MRLRSEDLDWRQIDDEIVALDRREAVYLTVNGSGALLWRLLAEHASHEDLVAALIDAYAIDSELASADTDAFLAGLTEKGLLER